MDHDKQVKELTTQTTIGRFLNRPLIADDRDRDNFDLESEFAKTAKNKSPLVPLVVAAFLVVLAVGAWVASQFTEQASQKSSASIGSFEDLKLKEIFDTVRKNKKDLEAIQTQMDQLTQASNAKVAALTQAGSSKADIASVNDSSGTQAKAIQAQTTRQIAAERAALKASLAPLQTQADEVQKKIDTYDDRIGQMNKKNQQVLDTQQRLFDLEKKKITDQYETRLLSQTEEAKSTLARVKQERDDLVAALKAKSAEDIRKLILKYNPVLADSPVAAQIEQFGSATAVYPAVLSPELQSLVTDQLGRSHLLVDQLKQIPYQNSVPGLINALDNAFADSLTGYDAYVTKLDGVIATRDATIVQLETSLAGLQTDLAAVEADRRAADALNAADKLQDQAYLARWTGGVDDYLATLKEDGLFVDVRDAQDWLIVLKSDRAKALQTAVDLAAANPVAPVAGKPVVPVNLATVRDGSNNSELGTVTVEAVSGGWRAKLVKLSDSKKPFKAFDRLVLTLPAKK